jgi:glyoxylase-like metal-dependent hydrolase (beta-lactamase superfamily II)
MRRIARISLAVLAVLALAAWGAWSYLTAREGVPETSDYALDVEELRRLAASLPGPRPLRVNHELVAEAALPRGALFAGEPFDPQIMAHGAYQVVFPGSSLVIDAGFDQAFHARMPGERPFFPDGFASVQRGLREARWIVVTHEHADHIAGLGSFPEPALLPGKLALTREQGANSERLDEAGFSQTLRAALGSLEYDHYHALAPGVVLVKAPGHTPGSQLVYVALESGKELLFLGDVAWHLDQIRDLHYRPRLVTDFFIGEDRAAVLAQFRTLHDLAEREPIVLVVSHDMDQRKALIASGVLGEHFEF